MKRGMNNCEYVKFNSEVFEAEVKKNKINKQKLALAVLDISTSSYARYMSKGEMPKELLEKACEYCKIDIHKVLNPVKNPEVEVEKKPATIQQNDSELLVVGMNCILEDQKAMVKLLTDLVDQIKISNQKLSRIEEKMHTLENATGACVSNLIQVKDNTKATVETIERVRSNTALISGRVKDLTDKYEDKKPNFKVINN